MNTGFTTLVNPATPVDAPVPEPGIRQAQRHRLRLESLILDAVSHGRFREAAVHTEARRRIVNNLHAAQVLHYARGDELNGRAAEVGPRAVVA